MRAGTRSKSATALSKSANSCSMPGGSTRLPAFCHCGTYIQSWPLKGCEKIDGRAGPESTSFNSGAPLAECEMHDEQPSPRRPVSERLQPRRRQLIGDQFSTDELHVSEPLLRRRRVASGTSPPRPWRRNRAWARRRPSQHRRRGFSRAAAWASRHPRPHGADERPAPRPAMLHQIRHNWPGNRVDERAQSWASSSSRFAQPMTVSAAAKPTTTITGCIGIQNTRTAMAQHAMLPKHPDGPAAHPCDRGPSGMCVFTRERNLSRRYSTRMAAGCIVAGSAVLYGGTRRPVSA